MTAPLDCQRDLFEIPEHVAYLNAAAYVPLPIAVREAGEKGVLTKSHPWNMGREQGNAAAERTRAAAARMIGAAADDVAITGAVSYGIATAAKNLPIAAGSRVLMIEGEFPSLARVWMDLAMAAGAVVEVVARPADGDWTAALLEAIERPGARPVGLALLTPSHWSDGSVIDLARLMPALRAQDARVVIDATQAAGVLDIDVAALRPDFLAYPTYKWVCGPYSLAFLYVAPRWQEGVPFEEYGSVRVGNAPERYIPTARRFDRGERNDPIGLPMAAVGLELVQGWDRGALQARLRGLTDALAEAIADVPGVAMVRRDLRVPHVLGLRFAGGLPAGIGERLAARDVHVAERQGVLRVSPHVYNDERDVGRFAAALRAELG